MPWLRNEASAFKQKFTGLTTPTPNQGAPADVGVWFRTPENEIRDMTFPAIVLEYAGVNKADEREHRGVTTLPYIPEEFPDAGYQSVDEQTGEPVTFSPGLPEGEDFDPNNSPFKVRDYPIPYDVDFTVTIYSRYQDQLLPLVTALSKIDRIPPRFGYLEVPEDGTVRSLFVIGGPELVTGRDGEGRRLFQAVYRVRVPSELSLYDIEQITTRINSVSLDLHTIPDGS
jgi:hypothetical protein